MSGYIPPSWADIRSWQQQVASAVNPVLQGYPLDRLGSDPADPNEGFTYYSTAGHAPKWWDGAAWQTAGRNILEGLGDPGADSMVFWDDSAGAFAYLAPGTNLSISGTTLNASGAAWTQIGSTLTPTGVGTVTFSSIPSTYNDLLIEFNGISHNSGSNRNLTVQVGDGTNFATNVSAASASIPGANLLSGAILMPHYRSTCGILIIGSEPVNADDQGDSAPYHLIVPWRFAAGLAAAKIAWSSGNYDAGSLKLFGR